MAGFRCTILTYMITTVAAGELEALQECTIGLGTGDQREMLTRMVSKIAALEAAVAAAEAKRREIHNQLVELKGNVRAWSGWEDWPDVILGSWLMLCPGWASACKCSPARNAVTNRPLCGWLQIRVFCRVRPSPRSVVSYLPDGLSVKLQVEGKEHPFSYDKVFRSESTQVSSSTVQRHKDTKHEQLAPLMQETSSHAHFNCMQTKGRH